MKDSKVSASFVMRSWRQVVAVGPEQRRPRRRSRCSSSITAPLNDADALVQLEGVGLQLGQVRAVALAIPAYHCSQNRGVRSAVAVSA